MQEYNACYILDGEYIYVRLDAKQERLTIEEAKRRYYNYKHQGYRVDKWVTILNRGRYGRWEPRVKICVDGRDIEAYTSRYPK